MIIYTEKGAGLHSAISSAGQSLYQLNNEWVASDDVAVQAIIDAYDPLPLARQEAKQRLIDQFNTAMSAVEDAFPEAEKRTFTKQETEARAFTLDDTASTPTLSAIAGVRGVTVEYLSSRVIAKADSYTAQVGALMGLRQVLEDQIDAETDWQVIQQINLGI